MSHLEVFTPLSGYVATSALFKNSFQLLLFAPVSASGFLRIPHFCAEARASNGSSNTRVVSEDMRQVVGSERRDGEQDVAVTSFHLSRNCGHNDFMTISPCEHSVRRLLVVVSPMVLSSFVLHRC